ncbi:MAG TPA: hypothetical protein PKW18_08755 [Candidatus Sumerlaeota bacterium]|nr:MAG: hypothetical protein BWY12_02563 [candidate division BRC1 bacterium ADurb.Bin183]HOE63468.1 hypothetical protein [Candidatus Sumerlaeota bacterium]HRR30809.1 hypothetical protein [Candidatus Sumerlaeia bacterium]HON50947.1 hypothetical protein [Candidatus Sumerlaeota bacterium]HOR65641.1 hypothetical protein [Candidatus Sumerlaeota bacterium]
MAREDVKIIIKKNGEIWVDMGNLAPQQVQYYKQIFEEILGPIKGELASWDGGTPPPAVRLAQSQQEEDEGEKKEILKQQ